jgi:diguanylate cyclase (GGDEF)-like protein
LEHTLKSYARQMQHGALIFIDLDNFKTLNDTRGHHIGDLLLELVSTRLLEVVRTGDTVARLGGDEFVVMLENLSDDKVEAAQQAETVGGKVLDALNHPYELENLVHHVSPSIGVTLFGAGVIEDVHEPLKRADLAMYQAKAAGRNAIRFYDIKVQTLMQSRVALEASLRMGLEREEFQLYYQPQVDSEAKIIGAEVLLRWPHPQRGMVSPSEFIPLAEETGLIIPLGLWVMNQACRQLAHWGHQPQMSSLVISVNVSARQIAQTGFVEQVLGALRKNGARAERLKLELTESMLVSNVEDTIAKMNALRAFGVGLSLDDFGTGYSSLSYLKRLPLDQLKVDQGFVRDLLVDNNDAAIAQMVIALGGSLSLRVIAEGVETEAQREALAKMGCHAYQGYLFGRPMPLHEFESLHLGMSEF